MSSTMYTVAQALYGKGLQKATPCVQSYAVSFIEGSRVCGTASWPSQWSHEVAHVPYSIAYFCNICGDIWARILVHENPEHWFLTHHRCKKHSGPLGGFNVGGTFFNDIAIQEDFDIPKHILAEDFLFLMTLLDKSADSYIP